jgi:hypothetical protein
VLRTVTRCPAAQLPGNPEFGPASPFGYHQLGQGDVRPILTSIHFGWLSMVKNLCCHHSAFGGEDRDQGYSTVDQCAALPRPGPLQHRPSWDNRKTRRRRFFQLYRDPKNRGVADARRRNGGIALVALIGSSHAFLLAMVQARVLPAQEGQLMSRRDELDFSAARLVEPRS